MEGRRLIICGLLLMLTGGLMVFSSYKRIGNENENEKLTNKLKEKQLLISDSRKNSEKLLGQEN